MLFLFPFHRRGLCLLRKCNNCLSKISGAVIHPLQMQCMTYLSSSVTTDLQRTLNGFLSFQATVVVCLLLSSLCGSS